MTKKKIGELDGTPIVTGGKNYANEHEYYMTLNGDNTYQKLEQRTNGDLFRLVLGSGGSTNPGYTVTKSYTVIDEETITTVDHGGYNNEDFTEALDIVIGDTYKVTFNGTEYTCVAYDYDGDTAFGATWDDNLHNYDFSEYPFNIRTFSVDEGEYETMLTTESAGEYSVKIEHLEESVETTHDFESAVKDVLLTNEKNLLIYPDTIDYESSPVTAVYNKEFVIGNTYIVPFGDSSGTRLLPFYLESIEYYYPEGEPSIDSPIMTSIRTERIGSWIRDNNGTIAFIPEGNGLSDGYIIRIESSDGINWRCWLLFHNSVLS